MSDVFKKIYETNYWRSGQSASGSGSELDATGEIRKRLPSVFRHLGITTILDIPCGDFYWGRMMEWPENYIGADIVPALIEKNKHDYTVPGKARYFEVLDAIKDPLPKADMILCRDMLGHLPKLDVLRVLQNFRASGSTWLLATTFPNHETDGDIKEGEWHPINLASMYGLPDPKLLINEKCTEGGGIFSDKSLGLWRLND